MHRLVAEEVLNVGKVFGRDSHLFCQPITRALAMPTRMRDFMSAQVVRVVRVVNLNSGEAAEETTAADSRASLNGGN